MQLGFKYPHLYAIPETNQERYDLGITGWATPQIIGQSQGFRIYWTRITALRQIIGDKNIGIHQSLRDVVKFRDINTKATHITDDEAALVMKYFQPDFQPRDYQARGITWLSKRGSGIIADEAGLGKTIQSAGSVVVRSNVRPDDVRGAALVVTPASVKFQWESELKAMFINDADGEALFGIDDIKVINGPPKFRKRQMSSQPPFWVIINYDLLLRDFDQLTRWFDEYGLWAVIFDESSIFKNIESKTFARCQELIKRYSPPVRYCLNATPVENGVRDLYCQSAIIEPDLFPSYENFETRYVDMVRLHARGNVFWKDRGVKNLSELRELIRDIYIRREYADVGEEIPSVISITVPIELTTAQRNRYHEIEDDEESFEPMFKVGELTRAALFYAKENGKIESPKFSAIHDIVMAEKGNKVVVASESKKFINAAAKYLDGKGIKTGVITSSVDSHTRSDIVTNFTKGQTQVLLGTSAIERGLNLQAACVFINADIPWNPAKIYQRVGRVRRLKSAAKVVRLYNLKAVNTIEERIVQTVLRKDRIAQDIFDVSDPSKIDHKRPHNEIMTFRCKR